MLCCITSRQALVSYQADRMLCVIKSRQAVLSYQADRMLWPTLCRPPPRRRAPGARGHAGRPRLHARQDQARRAAGRAPRAHARAHHGRAVLRPVRRVPGGGLQGLAPQRRRGHLRRAGAGHRDARHLPRRGAQHAAARQPERAQAHAAHERQPARARPRGARVARAARARGGHEPLLPPGRRALGTAEPPRARAQGVRAGGRADYPRGGGGGGGGRSSHGGSEA